jgi:hypothetical protein
MVNWLKGFVKNITAQQSPQYRIVKETLYDEVLLECIDIFYLEKKVSLNWYSVVDRPFYQYAEAIKYFHKYMEYLKNTEVKYEYLDNTKLETK